MENNPVDKKQRINDGKIDLKLFRQECSSLRDAISQAWQQKTDKHTAVSLPGQIMTIMLR